MIKNRTKECFASAFLAVQFFMPTYAVSSWAGVAEMPVPQQGIRTSASTATDDQAKTVSVKDFGAIGNGIVNDTDAFEKASEYITARSGGRLIIPAGTYIVGKQTFAGANGKGYAYQAASIISVTNATKPVIIEGQGAVLRMATGLRFGSFDPISGAPNAPAMPNTKSDYGADVGVMINLQGNTNVTVNGLELDGNSGGLVLGGRWGDTGYQRSGYGIRAYNNDRLTISNVYTHHHGTDGIIVGWTGATADMDARPALLTNVRSEYNSRQGLSWVGGVGLTVIKSKFNHTGRGAFSSSPAAGIDIEAEGAVIRKGVFINVEAGDNVGYGVVADSGDSSDISFRDSAFYGTTQGAVWPKKPRMRFYNTLIAGGASNAYTTTNQENRTEFIDCRFSGDEKFEGVPAVGTGYLADFTGQNPVFERTSFVTNNPRVRLQASSVSATYRDSMMVQNGSTAQALPRGTFEGVNTINVSTGSIDLSGTVNHGRLTVSGRVYGANPSADGHIPVSVAQ